MDEQRAAREAAAVLSGRVCARCIYFVKRGRHLICHAYQDGGISFRDAVLGDDLDGLDPECHGCADFAIAGRRHA